MFAEPVKEIEKLHKNKHTAKQKQLAESKSVELDVSGDIFDIRTTFEIGNATAVGLDIGGERVTYNVNGNNLNGAAMKPVDGKVTIQVLVDRPILEICGNKGRGFITRPHGKKGDVKTVEAFAIGRTARLISLEANELESIWKVNIKK